MYPAQFTATMAIHGNIRLSLFVGDCEENLHKAIDYSTSCISEKYAIKGR